MIVAARMIALYVAAIGHAGAGLEHPPALAPPMQTALASWYGLAGTGACGLDAQSGLRFASLIVPCGARVLFCYRDRCATGTRADSGPFVSGRSFDLNANLRAAIACPDLCTVRYRVIR